MYTRGREVVNGSTPEVEHGLPPACVRGYMGPMAPLRWISSLPVVVVAACGGAGSGAPTGVTQVTIAPPPDGVTRATLSGPLCEGEVCTCRDPAAPADGGAGVPDAAVKRFEIRVGPAEHELWVTLDDMVLYKSTARAEDCFYVDLGPGDHRMGLRASHGGGVSAKVTVKEYGPATASWYDTFEFACGAPGVCAHDELDAYKASLAVYKRGIHDPCGSVKIKQIGWDTGRAADQLHPDDLQVGWTLDIFDFPARKPHGDPSCATRFE